MVDGWVAMNAVFGATYEAPTIEPSRTLKFAHAAATRVREVAQSGARVAFATAVPASLLTIYFALARIAAAAGAEVEELGDVGPIRADGRHPRWLRCDRRSRCRHRWPGVVQHPRRRGGPGVVVRAQPAAARRGRRALCRGGLGERDRGRDLRGPRPLRAGAPGRPPRPLHAGADADGSTAPGLSQRGFGLLGPPLGGGSDRPTEV